MKPQLFLRNFGLTLTMLCLSLFAQAQTKALDVNVDINKGGASGGAWYASPWAWIVGAAVFILLLAAILRGGNSRSDA